MILVAREVRASVGGELDMDGDGLVCKRRRAAAGSVTVGRRIEMDSNAITEGLRAYEITVDDGLPAS